MQTNQINLIHNIVQLIEANIHETLDLDAIAEESGFSKFYIDRLFKGLTGETLMNYVRGRRLTLSLDDLVNTNLKIIDIAQNYHFSYEQTYIRAFKKQFHMTPAQYRRSHCDMQEVKVLKTSDLYPAGEGLLVAPQICTLPQLYLQGIEREIIHSHNYFHQDSNQLVKEWGNNYFPNIKRKAAPSVYMGFVQYTENAHGRMYAACTEVKSLTTAVSPVKNYTIPAHHYASFKYVGLHSPYEITFKTLQSLYNRINEWKAQTAYLQVGGYHLERIDLKKCDKEYCEMDILVPVYLNEKEK